MAMTTVTPATIKTLQSTFNGLFWQGHQNAPTWYPRLVTEVPSSSKENTYGWMKRLDSMREFVGSRVLESLAAHSYTLANKKWEKTVAVDAADIEDDNLGVYNPVVQELGEVSALHPQNLLVTLIENTTDLCHDGQAFFAAAHPVDPYESGKGTQANLLTSTAFTEANFFAARKAFAQLKDEGGRMMGLLPDLVVVPQALEQTARKVLLADTAIQTAGTAGTDLAATAPTNIARGLADLLVVPQLTSDTTWYAFVTKKVIRPFVYQMRKPLSFTSKTSGASSDYVWENDSYAWSADARYNVGFGPWWLGMKCTA